MVSHQHYDCIPFLPLKILSMSWTCPCCHSPQGWIFRSPLSQSSMQLIYSKVHVDGLWFPSMPKWVPQCHRWCEAPFLPLWCSIQGRHSRGTTPLSWLQMSTCYKQPPIMSLQTKYAHPYSYLHKLCWSWSKSWFLCHDHEPPLNCCHHHPGLVPVTLPTLLLPPFIVAVPWHSYWENDIQVWSYSLSASALIPCSRISTGTHLPHRYNLHLVFHGDH